MNKDRGKRIMDSFITDLYGMLGRRKFIKGLSVLAGGAAAATYVLPLLEDARAGAEQVQEDDPRLFTQDITYKGATGDIKAKLARPKGDVKLPGVIVIHENRGLTPHIEDVARRVAVEGFISLAPDALSPLGGTPADENKAVSMIGQLDQAATVKNFVAAVQYLKNYSSSTGKVGVVGFCWGGGMANQLAVNSPDLKAAVPYYGRQPATEDVPKIKASLLLQYAGNDDMINKGIPEYEAALEQAHADYKMYMYEGAQHAFNNDTNKERYNREAADLAWKRTIAFFKEKLKN